MLSLCWQSHFACCGLPQLAEHQCQVRWFGGPCVHPAAEMRPIATSASDIASQLASVWKGFDRFLVLKKLSAVLAALRLQFCW